MPEPEIIDEPLPEGVLGYTDGTGRIWLDDQLLSVDRAIVLEHELIHYYRGHTGRCLTVTEYGIDREIACRRVTVNALGEVAAGSGHTWVIADDLDVMSETIETRPLTLTLTLTERQALDGRHVQWPVALNGPSSDDAWWVRQVHDDDRQRSHTAVVPGHGASVGAKPSRS